MLPTFRYARTYINTDFEEVEEAYTTLLTTPQQLTTQDNYNTLFGEAITLIENHKSLYWGIENDFDTYVYSYSQAAHDYPNGPESFFTRESQAKCINATYQKNPSLDPSTHNPYFSLQQTYLRSLLQNQNRLIEPIEPISPEPHVKFDLVTDLQKNMAQDMRFTFRTSPRGVEYLSFKDNPYCTRVSWFDELSDLKEKSK